MRTRRFPDAAGAHGRGGGQTFANPRNSAAGSLRQKNPEVTRRGRCTSSPMPGARPASRSATTQYDVVAAFRRLGLSASTPMARCASTRGAARALPRDRGAARRTALRHRRRRLQGRPARPAGAARLRLAQPALGDRAQIPGRAGDDGARRHRHPGRPHRRADAGGAAGAGHGRRRRGASTPRCTTRTTSAASAATASRSATARTSASATRSSSSAPATSSRRSSTSCWRSGRRTRAALRFSRHAVRSAAAMRVREDGRGDRAPLHRRPDLPGAGGRAPAPFRLAQRLRHRGPRREADRVLLQQRQAGAEGRARRPTSSRCASGRRRCRRRLKRHASGAKKIDGFGAVSVKKLFAAIDARREVGARRASSSRSASAMSARPTPSACARHFGHFDALRNAARSRRGAGRQGRPGQRRWQELDARQRHRRDRGRGAGRVLRRGAQPRGARRAARRRGARRSTRSRVAAGRRRSPARRSSSPARWRRCRATRPRRWPNGSAPRSRARCRRRPTSSSPARAPARSSSRRAELGIEVIDEDDWFERVGRLA